MQPRRPPRGPRPQDRRSPGPARGPARDERLETGEPTYGLRAGLALIVKRPGDVTAVACSPEAAREVSDALASRAETRHLRPTVEADAALERLAGTRQHEGLVVSARPRRFASPAELADLLTRIDGAALALDRVRNPYNVGAILRTAAFFGVDAALLGTPAPHPALAPDAVRVAEGGAEQLLLSRTTDLADTLARLRARGVQVVGADGAASASAIGFRFARPTMLVVGNERDGLGDRVRAQCDAIVAIPGTGSVESLNVAVAASILIAEVVRGQGRRP